MAPVDALWSLDQPLKHCIPLDVGMRFGDERVEVVALPILKLAAPELHVLSRHRLLLKPHGFEGVGVVPEELQTEDSTLTQRKDERGLLMELRALADAA